MYRTVINFYVVFQHSQCNMHKPELLLTILIFHVQGHFISLYQPLPPLPPPPSPPPSPPSPPSPPLLSPPQAGREGRDKFGSRKHKLNPQSSTSNRQKERGKAFAMVKRKKGLRRKTQRSFREKQVCCFCHSCAEKIAY